MYRHHNWRDALLDYPVSKVVCVGSNYTNHIKEVGGNIPEEPVLSIRPKTAPRDLHQPLVIPSDIDSVHHEVELVMLIGTTLRQAMEEHVHKAIAGYDVALDLILHDIQGRMKKAGRPWGEAKSSDNSCPLSGLVPVAKFNGDPRGTMLGLAVDGELRQHSTTADMIHHIVPLVAYMSRFFTLKVGNVVSTGTLVSVGLLNNGDELAISLHDQTLTTRVLQSLLAASLGGKTCIGVPGWL